MPLERGELDQVAVALRAEIDAVRVGRIQASRSGSACLAMISPAGSGRATTSVTSEISLTARPSYRLATPSARIRPATASQAPPSVSAWMT